MLPRAAARAFAKRLMSEETVARASRTLTEHSRDLRKAILSTVDHLQGLAPDDPKIYADAHEIRGLAETVGLAATGRIAARLCGYFEGARRAALAVDPLLVRLHVDAIVRAANAVDEAELLGDTVARELDALVARRLADTPKR